MDSQGYSNSQQTQGGYSGSAGQGGYANSQNPNSSYSGSQGGTSATGGGSAPAPPVPLFPPASSQGLTANPKLANAVQGAVRALESKYSLATGTLPLSISIADISSGSGPFPVGGFKATEEHYIASEAKVCAMFAAFALKDFAQRVVDAKGLTTQAALFTELKSSAVLDAIKTAVPQIASATNIGDTQRIPNYAAVLTAAMQGGKLVVDHTSAFQKSLHEMIVPSNNVHAGLCVRGVGYGYLNGALAAAGYLDTSIPNGLWLAGDYSQEKIWKTVRIQSVNDQGVGQAATADAMVEMVAQIWTKSIIDAGACDSMIALLKDAATGVDVPWAKRAHILPDASFIGNKLGLGPLKSGKEVRCEVSVLKDPGKADHLYVLAWHNLIGIGQPINFADVATLLKAAIDKYEI